MSTAKSSSAKFINPFQVRRSEAGSGTNQRNTSLTKTKFTYNRVYKHDRGKSKEVSPGSLRSGDSGDSHIQIINRPTMNRTLNFKRGLESKYLSSKTLNEENEENDDPNCQENSRDSVSVSSFDSHSVDIDNSTKTIELEKNTKSKFRPKQNDDSQPETNPEYLSEDECEKEAPTPQEQTEKYQSRHERAKYESSAGVPTISATKAVRDRKMWDFSSSERTQQSVKNIREQAEKQKSKKAKKSKKSKRKSQKEVEPLLSKRSSPKPHQIKSDEDQSHKDMDQTEDHQNTLVSNLERANELLSTRNVSIGPRRATSCDNSRGLKLRHQRNLSNVSNSSSKIPQIHAAQEARLIQLSNELVKSAEQSLNEPKTKCTNNCAKTRVENISLKKLIELEKEKFENMAKLYKDKISRLSLQLKHANKMLEKYDRTSHTKSDSEFGDYEGVTKDIMLQDYKQVLKTLHDNNTKLEKESVRYRDLVDVKTLSSSEVLQNMINYLKKQAKIKDDRLTSRNYEFKKRAVSIGGFNRSAIMFTPAKNLDSSIYNESGHFGSKFDETDSFYDDLNSRLVTPIRTEKLYRSPRRF